MEMQNQFDKIIEELQKKCPVIHHITNYVTVESCADAAICAGASPVMADDPEEVENITAGSDALVLNIGTIDYNKTIAMERAAAAAKKKGIPVVLDPVGAMSSAMRLNFALKLLQSGAITVVRGNYDECKALVDEKAAGRGVDGITQADEGEKLQAAKALAAKFNCVVALTFDREMTDTEATIGGQTVTAKGGSATLYFPVWDLQYATDYTFTIAAGAAKDTYGNGNAEPIDIEIKVGSKAAVAKVAYDYVVGTAEEFSSAIAEVNAANTSADAPRKTIFIKNGDNHKAKVITPKVAEIGRSKNAVKSHSDLSIDCMKVFSSISPKTKPKMHGATGISCKIITKASTPKPNMAKTSK